MDKNQKCLCFIAILLSLIAYSVASSVSISTNASVNTSGNASNSGGVSTFVPDKVINSSGVDIGNSYTTCLGLGVYCYVGITNYPNASIGDNFQSHFTTPINFSNLTIYSIDDSTRGIADLYINNNLVSSNIDFYKPNTSTFSKKKINLGGTYPPGYYNFTLVVTGKNASATGYILHISQMTLWMEGHDNYNQSFDGVSDTNNYYFNQTFINGSSVNQTSMDGKVNKSGDTMTGNLIHNLSNISSAVITSQMLVGVNLNSNSTPPFFPNDAKTGLGSDYVAQLISEGNSPTIAYIGYGNDSMFEGPAFSAIRKRGNISTPLPIQNGDFIFAINGRGQYDTSATQSTSKATITMEAVGNWSGTSMGTLINIYTTTNGTTTNTKRLTINDNGDVTIYKLAGVGNAYTCVDANGKLYRGSPAC